MALGQPGELQVTAGIVSGLSGSFRSWRGGQVERLIQTTAERVRHSTGATYVVVTDRDELDKQIEGVLAAQKDMDGITEKLPENAKPDPKVDAQLDEVAKKNGFASYAEYNNVVDNISLVLGGFDPATKKYVGTEAVIKAQIAQVQADKKMPAKDKKEALADLNDALKSPQPAIENKGNIDLVGKYYDKLADALGDDQQ